MSNLSVNFSTPPTGLDAVQNRNSPAIGANEQNTAQFDVFMNAPAEDFQSKIKNLQESDQQQIKEGLNKYNDSLKGALDALTAAPKPPQLDEIRRKEVGYVDEYFKQSEEYFQKSGAAIGKTQEAIDAGIALLDTLEGIDPALAKAPPLPDQGKNMIALMSVLGSSPQEIDHIEKAFGLSQ